MSSEGFTNCTEFQIIRCLLWWCFETRRATLGGGAPIPPPEPTTITSVCPPFFFLLFTAVLLDFLVWCVESGSYDEIQLILVRISSAASSTSTSTTTSVRLLPLLVRGTELWQFLPEGRNYFSIHLLVLLVESSTSTTTITTGRLPTKVWGSFFLESESYVLQVSSRMTRTMIDSTRSIQSWSVVPHQSEKRKSELRRDDVERERIYSFYFSRNLTSPH